MRWLLTLLAALFPCLAASAQINGPDQRPAGSLVILRATAIESTTTVEHRWMLIGNDDADAYYVDDDALIFASGVPGVYTFVLCSIGVDGDCKPIVIIDQHSVTIGDPPAPGPGPGPQPPKPPAPDLTGLQKESCDVARKVVQRPGEAAAFADVLETVASQAAGLGWDAATINQEYRSRLAQTVFGQPEVRTRWTAFATWLSETLPRAGDDASQLMEMFADIATGLRASTPATVSKGGATLKGTVNDIASELEALREAIGNE